MTHFLFAAGANSELMSCAERAANQSLQVLMNDLRVICPRQDRSHIPMTGHVTAAAVHTRVSKHGFPKTNFAVLIYVHKLGLIT